MATHIGSKEMKIDEGTYSNARTNEETKLQKPNKKVIDLNELPDDQGNMSMEEGRFQVVQMMTKIYFPSVYSLPQQVNP